MIEHPDSVHKLVKTIGILRAEELGLTNPPDVYATYFVEILDEGKEWGEHGATMTLYNSDTHEPLCVVQVVRYLPTAALMNSTVLRERFHRALTAEAEDRVAAAKETINSLTQED